MGVDHMAVDQMAADQFAFDQKMQNRLPADHLKLAIFLPFLQLRKKISKLCNWE
jgi:hypothetical protein